MKYILKVILIILLIMLVAGLLFGFVFKDKNIDDKKTNILDFANEWSLTAGTGDNALTINQDTKSIILDDLSVDGAGGAFTEFKCNEKTYSSTISISISVNTDVWNASSKYSLMQFHGDVLARTFNFHGYELTENFFAEYYNQNKNDIVVKSGDCLATMTIEISFVFPESIEMMKKMYDSNGLPKEYLSFKDSFIYLVNIPIVKK